LVFLSVLVKNEFQNENLSLNDISKIYRLCFLNFQIRISVSIVEFKDMSSQNSLLIKNNFPDFEGNFNVTPKFASTNLKGIYSSSF
jgi:hypothetical protein